MSIYWGSVNTYLPLVEWVYTEGLWKLTAASGRVSINWGSVNTYLPLAEWVYTEDLWKLTPASGRVSILRVCEHLPANLAGWVYTEVCEHLPASGRASIYWGLWTLTCLWQSVYILRVCEHLPASGRASIYRGFVNTYLQIWQGEYILRFVNTYLPLAEWVYTEGLWQISAGYFGFHQHFYHIPIFLSHTNSTLKKETHAVLVTNVYKQVNVYTQNEGNLTHSYWQKLDRCITESHQTSKKLIHLHTLFLFNCAI